MKIVYSRSQLLALRHECQLSEFLIPLSNVNSSFSFHATPIVEFESKALSSRKSGPYIVKYEPGMVIPSNAIPIEIPVQYNYAQKEKPIRVQVTRFKVRASKRNDKREVTKENYSPVGSVSKGTNVTRGRAKVDTKTNDFGFGQGSVPKALYTKEDEPETKLEARPEPEFKWAPFFEPFIGKSNFKPGQRCITKQAQNMAMHPVADKKEEIYSAGSEYSSSSSMSVQIQLPEV
ncbi:hypothetical protein EJF18_30249 [Clavispora lusitaniae]|uniref:Uncharacterized protein n=2 Tax=Clavispora lusitaniae TaxID=36911 RepID=C4Y3C2_CLAL4|nr:uncharacterized protein CLUG_03035 [Clavispora lusitaniae ATCC 42720]QFZ27281.1 hypothetical protein EJF14_30249 [Clavispora lusitaniae]EEQ38909.1 predicted protein [Clavispora lusitaniae ATCC 42720]QFZ33411.1 hypothetical protein EJF16_30249 [Clavispora lusitaniae]QFZ39082.1 hypothetical protein EJF15_30249 [Clavispora lusitaniae]QFZ44764.1 hypothetical protein EJF18_30249 [Clavispora lusitaniae]